jgi:uncharacterized membrane protein
VYQHLLPTTSNGINLQNLVRHLEQVESNLVMDIDACMICSDDGQIPIVTTTRGQVSCQNTQISKCY